MLGPFSIFIVVVWKTAPAVEPEAPADIQWLPAPETPDGDDRQ